MKLFERVGRGVADIVLKPAREVGKGEEAEVQGTTTTKSTTTVFRRKGSALIVMKDVASYEEALRGVHGPVDDPLLCVPATTSTSTSTMTMTTGPPTTRESPSVPHLPAWRGQYLFPAGTKGARRTEEKEREEERQARAEGRWGLPVYAHVEGW